MDKISITHEIKTRKNLLSIPQVISELVQATSREDFSIDSLTKIILKDPSLTGNILQLANSPFYARRSEIKTVNQAVSVLGATTVKCLALATSIFHPEKIHGDSGVDAQDFFAYTLTVSTAADRLAKATGYKDAEEALIAGLLHDIGVVYFLDYHPAEYAKVLKMQIKGMPLIEAEQAVFDIDHCELGSRLASSWHLPESITRAIQSHHSVEVLNKEDELENIVRLSVLMTFDRFSDQESNLEGRLTTISRLLKVLGLKRVQFNKISRSVLSDALELAQSMRIEIGDTESLLTKANQEIWKSYQTVEQLFKERRELSKRLLKEERAKGATEAKAEALATLSHYLNNTVMAISGRGQIMEMLYKAGKTDKLIEQVPTTAQVINTSVMKLVAVMEEMREISPIHDIEYFRESKALNIDERIKKRMVKLEIEADGPLSAMMSDASLHE